MSGNIKRQSVYNAKMIGSIQLFIGIVITAVFGIVLIKFLGIPYEEQTSALIVIKLICIGIMIIGIIILTAGYRKHKLVKKFDLYSKILGSDPNKYLSVLAISAKETLEVTKKNVSKMIQLGFFPGMYIEDAKNRLIYQGINQNAVSAAQKAAIGNYAEVKCNGCGAVGMVLKGTTGTCEYCGSPLSTD